MKKTVAKKEEKEPAAKSVEEKIRKILAIGTAVKSLKEEDEKIKDYLRFYVERYPTGITPKKEYEFWQGKTIGVELQRNPLFETDAYSLVMLIGFAQAAKYLEVNRTALVADIEAKVIPLTLEQLENITQVTFGKKKVVPYYGQRYTVETKAPPPPPKKSRTRKKSR